MFAYTWRVYSGLYASESLVSYPNKTRMKRQWPYLPASFSKATAAIGSVALTTAEYNIPMLSFHWRHDGLNMALLMYPIETTLKA